MVKLEIRWHIASSPWLQVTTASTNEHKLLKINFVNIDGNCDDQQMCRELGKFSTAKQELIALLLHIELAYKTWSRFKFVELPRNLERVIMVLINSKLLSFCVCLLYEIIIYKYKKQLNKLKKEVGMAGPKSKQTRI